MGSTHISDISTDMTVDQSSHNPYEQVRKPKGVWIQCNLVLLCCASHEAGIVKSRDCMHPKQNNDTSAWKGAMISMERCSVECFWILDDLAVSDGHVCCASPSHGRDAFCRCRGTKKHGSRALATGVAKVDQSEYFALPFFVSQ